MRKSLLKTEQSQDGGERMNRILVIDDDRELCTLIRRTVSQENIAADCYHSGRAGLEKLKENQKYLQKKKVKKGNFKT